MIVTWEFLELCSLLLNSFEIFDNQKFKKTIKKLSWKGFWFNILILLMAKLGTEILNDLFKMMLTPARVFTPTESIKLTCVKSRMTVWMLSPGGINLCSSSGNVFLMTIGGYFTSSSSSGFVPSSPSTSASYVKN